MPTANLSDWAEGLHLTVTGLSKDQRKQVRDVVEAGGGRYSPNFSKRCTHLIVSTEQSDASQLKLYLASINKDKWHAQAVRFEWLLECASQSRQVDEDAFAVEAPKHEDLSILQQRLQEVATPTASAAGESNVPGVNKRGALELEVHTNVTMRSAPRQSSKRHKQLPSHVLQPQQHVSQAAKAADAMSMQVYSEADRADAAQPQQALQYQVKDTIIAAWPLMLGQAQKPGVSWTKPLLRPPQLQLPLPPPATIRSDSMPSAQPAAVTSLVHAPSLASAAGNAGHAVSVRSRQNPYTAENQPMMVDCQGWEQQADTSGSGGASDLAAKLQCMQADARAGAWSQHKGHGLTKGKSQRDHAPACTVANGKGESAPAKASKPDGQQHQRFPFASRTTNSCQPPDKTKPGMSASHLGASAPKRSKPSEVSGGAPAVVHTAKAAAGPVDQQGQESGRCIRLMEPVHSGTALDSRSCPQQRSHRLRSPAGSPAGSSRHRSSYTSVGPPIPVGPQPCAPAAVDIPAAPVGRAEATANTGQEQPEAAVQHRLGKATPLKKSFTPRPSRFRLEAERLSVTPPDKSSGLEKSGAQHAPQGVFSGMHIILDPELTAEENSRMHEAVRAGGGQVVGGAYLGSGATHVICHPQAAVKWLAMGLSIVSPAWLLRSLAQGTPDRCLHMSLDASRHLPPSVKSRQAQGSSLAPSADGVAFPQDLADRQARQTFVQQLQDQEVHQQWGLAQQALPTPQTMLDEVLWCVTDAPETARLDTLHLSTGHSYRGGGQDVEVADYSSTMSATQEACQAELDKADAMCSSSGFSGSAAASSEASDGLPGRQLQEGDWQEIVYKAPALTLLLPLDSIGACGHRSRSLHIPPCGCSRRHMLHSIYSFYQEVLSVSDQLQMMHSSSGAANVVKEVFVEGAPVKHMALLGAKVNLEGLERVSRDLTGTIYELKLSC
ncbi:hypothetical protein WJX77_010236 [Trebouxia sp. C0004]